MMRRAFFCLIYVVFVCAAAFANDAASSSPSSVSQTIEGFELSGFNPDGSKDWDVHGKTAYIADDTMRFDRIEGHGYTENDVVKVSSKEGLYDQRTGNLLLKKDVVAESQTGAKILTDEALWDTSTNTIKTDSRVVALKDGSVAKGSGAELNMDNNTVDMKQDVTVELARKDGDSIVKTSIECAGPLQINYKEKTAVFSNNVVVHDKDTVIHSDKLFVYFNNEENRITEIIAKGNVRIVKGDNETKGQEAHYDVSTQELTMTGRPTVLFYGEGDSDAPFGN